MNINSKLKIIKKKLAEDPKRFHDPTLFEDWTNEELRAIISHQEKGTPISGELRKKAEIVSRKMDMGALP